MVHAIVTSIKPFPNNQQTPFTPERVERSWHQATVSAVSALHNGTRACAVIVGESPERGLLFSRRDGRLKQFKIRLVQRELVIEVCLFPSTRFDINSNQIKSYYRLFGNKRPDFTPDDEIIVGRFFFHREFLLRKQGLLSNFLSESWTNLS